MVNRLAVYGKKLLGLSLIFNSLLSIFYAAGLLEGYYLHGWSLYVPYLVDGALFWVLVLAAIINIFPSAIVGRVRTGRLWFHHYVYGFFVSALAIAYLFVLAPISLFSPFTSDTMNVTVDVGRFFVLGGATLVLDDLPDVSGWLRHALCFLKLQVYRGRKIMHGVQYIMGCLSVYIFTAVTLNITENPQNATPANVILSATLFVTSISSFAVAKRKTWLQITS